MNIILNEKDRKEAREKQAVTTSSIFQTSSFSALKSPVTDAKIQHLNPKNCTILYAVKYSKNKNTQKNIFQKANMRNLFSFHLVETHNLYSSEREETLTIFRNLGQKGGWLVVHKANGFRPKFRRHLYFSLSANIWPRYTVKIGMIVKIQFSMREAGYLMTTASNNNH